MVMQGLMTHAGAHRVGVAEIESVTTPVGTRSWTPIPHGTFVNQIRATLERSRMIVTEEAHALGKDGDRYFGMLKVAANLPASISPDQKDYALVVGLRNSHDKSYPAGLVVGSSVFVCDNLAFSGEVEIARKHTTNIMRDLPSLIEGAVGRLMEVRGHQDRRIAAYKQTELTDAEAHDFLIQSLDARVAVPTMIPDLVKEWRTPRHPEFVEAGKTAWRLFNAFTEVGKERGSIFTVPKTTMALHGLMDTLCGVASLN